MIIIQSIEIALVTYIIVLTIHQRKIMKKLKGDINGIISNLEIDKEQQDG